MVLGSRRHGELQYLLIARDAQPFDSFLKEASRFQPGWMAYLAGGRVDGRRYVYCGVAPRCGRSVL